MKDILFRCTTCLSRVTRGHVHTKKCNDNCAIIEYFSAPKCDNWYLMGHMFMSWLYNTWKEVSVGHMNIATILVYHLILDRCSKSIWSKMRDSKNEIAEDLKTQNLTGLKVESLLIKILTKPLWCETLVGSMSDPCNVGPWWGEQPCSTISRGHQSPKRAPWGPRSPKGDQLCNSGTARPLVMWDSGGEFSKNLVMWDHGGEFKQILNVLLCLGKADSGGCSSQNR